jgi:hypothetical protein
MIIIQELNIKLLKPLVVCLRSEVLSTVAMKKVIFWDDTRYSLVEVFVGTHCLHLWYRRVRLSRPAPDSKQSSVALCWRQVPVQESVHRMLMLKTENEPVCFSTLHNLSYVKIFFHLVRKVNSFRANSGTCKGKRVSQKFCGKQATSSFYSLHSWRSLYLKLS